uniref:Dual specificity protein phosphatase n=1 Tax=Laticauda laticaudata TaxID=8630 RepID=A0A8C5RZE2_LATLA
MCAFGFSCLSVDFTFLYIEFILLDGAQCSSLSRFIWILSISSRVFTIPISLVSSANLVSELARLNITHILNASHNKWRGGADYYEGTGICYLGIEAHDSPTFDMSPYFQPAADFIHKALSKSGGRILVHCAVGVSRSATLVLAYLMIYHRLTLVEAIKTVKDHRGIIPNRGFLHQLITLDNSLRLKRRL